jgi:hypothetical protein
MAKADSIVTLDQAAKQMIAAAEDTGSTDRRAVYRLAEAEAWLNGQQAGAASQEGEMWAKIAARIADLYHERAPRKQKHGTTEVAGHTNNGG